MQLNVRISAALADQLRSAAVARHCTPGALVAQALEQFLAGGLAIATPAQAIASNAPDLKAILRRLEALERRPLAPPPPPSSPSPALAEAPAAKPPAAAAAPPPDGAICTADLAVATNTNRAAWNNWARDKNPGAIRRMPPEVGNWRYLGKAPNPELGGPDRGMWERA